MTRAAAMACTTVLAHLLYGCASASGPSRPPPAPIPPDVRAAGAHAPPPVCGAGQLRIDPAGGDAGMGHRAYAFRYTNVSPDPCTLLGYPTVRVLDTEGRNVADIPVTRAAGNYLAAAHPVRRITLDPEDSAWFEIGFSVIPHGDAACPRMAALAIAPPDGGRASRLALANSPCDGIEVLPLRATSPEP